MIARYGALVALILVLSACDSGSAAHQPSTPSSPTAHAQAADGGVKDLGALKHQADDAMRKVARKCMDAMGFTVFPADRQSGPIPQQLPDSYQPRVTEASAQDTGYGIGDSIRHPGAGASASFDDPFSQLPQADRDRFNKAWDGNTWPQQITLPDGTHVGMPAGGCLKQAMQQVYGDLMNYLQLSSISDNDENTAIDEAESDPKVKAARQAWAACMGAAGYPGLSEPDDAYTAAQRYYGTRGDTPTYSDAARAKEIKLADADAICAQQTNVDKVVWQARVQALTAYRTAHNAQFVAYRQLLEQALVKAQQALGAK